MQSLSALVRLSCLHLVAATPASPPGSIVILEPGENSFTIQWSPGASNDCNFQAWQVQLRSRNLNGTLVGSWRQATEVPTSRDSPNCTVDGLQRNSPYDLQIFERCANGADDSSAGEPEQVLWTLPGYWEIHIPPHDASSYVVEDTLEAHAGCEVIKSCCDDQFSLCFSGNEGLHLVQRPSVLTPSLAGGSRWAGDKIYICDVMRHRWRLSRTIPFPRNCQSRHGICVCTRPPMSQPKLCFIMATS